ncbi:MAG: hypothetical protein EXX96DRAFT_481644 [Benjaminiella poitrasii]|nr:MAG: hypothetical protein EXX96DRAFT_481644 [Benjaminiella poitrasii]
MIDMPIPSISITNKPSTGTSLYHTCRSVLDKLALVEGMTYYLEFEHLSLIQSNSGSNDPLTKLWELCRRGAPLLTLFNALDPAEPLKMDFNATHINECKKMVYHFIVACRNQLQFKEDDLFTLSDLYKDNTNGFIKVINTVDLILQLLGQKGIISFTNSTNRNSLNTTPKDTRDKVVHELLETERKYIQDLEVLQNYMCELQMQEILNPDTIHYLFGNLNALVDFQRRFLIHLEEIGEQPSEEQNFGELFSQMENQFTVYEPYCANYFSAQDLVVQEAPKLQKLADILNPVYELPSMLIKPVQRICKYPLLLQQLIKSMNPEWPHYEDLQEGLESVKRVTEKVNETQRKYENIQVVDELKRRIDEMRIAQIDSFGSLLLHDKLVMQQADEAEKEMYLYFFERTMLICKETKDATKNKPSNTISIKKKRRGSLQPKGLIVLSRIISARNISTGEGHWVLRVDWKDTEVNHITLRFRNEEQVKLWESTLKRKMMPMKSNVSNTQLASMKNAVIPSNVSAALCTDEGKDATTEEDLQGSRSNSISAHLFSTSRPKMIPRTFDPITKQRSHGSSSASSLSSAASSTFTRSSSHDYYHLASPPPSYPPSPTTTSSRASQSSTASTDIATKFMGIESEDYHRPQFPMPPSSHHNHHHPMNRSQSHSVPHHYPPQVSSIPLRLRSQSNPNIQHPIEPVPQVPTLNTSRYHHYQPTPPSPLDSPPYQPRTRFLSETTQTTIKIKLNYNDGIYVVMCTTDIVYCELMEKVERKIRLVANMQPRDILRLKYQDEDGDLITINSDEDVQMALESRRHSNTINLFVTI